MIIYNSLNGWKTFKRAYNDSNIASPYGVFALECHVHAHFGLLDYQDCQGNLPEDPDHYRPKQSPPLQDPSEVTDNLAAQSLLDLFQVITGKHTQEAYLAMMKNALYHLDHNDINKAWCAINKLKKILMGLIKVFFILIQTVTSSSKLKYLFSI